MEPLDDSSIAKSGLLVIMGGGLGWLLDYVIRFLRLKKDTKIELIDQDLRVSDSMLKYSNELRIDIRTLKDEIKVLKAENEKLHDIVVELRESIKDMYIRNTELKRKSDEFSKHLSDCVLKVARI